MDLCRCLCQEWDVASTLLTHKTDPCPALVGKRVLELGCGHGLPGIIPLLAGAQVHFQVRNLDQLCMGLLPGTAPWLQLHADACMLATAPVHHLVRGACKCRLHAHEVVLPRAKLLEPHHCQSDIVSAVCRTTTGRCWWS